jgi:phosphatidyl-myo-inositol dimannoside synthase
MRILLLTTDAYGGHGGIALYNRDLIEAFALMHEVEAIDVVPRARRFEVGTIPAKVRFFSDVIGSRFRFIAKSLSLLFSKPDVIICGHINLLAIAVTISVITRKPLVLVVYGIDVWERHGWLTKRLLCEVDRIWSISEITRDRMNEWAHVPVNRYAILPNAIHLDRYGNGSRDVELLKQWAIQEDAVMLLTVARLAGFERYKGIDEVIAAMPSLLERYPSLVYVVVGDGTDRARLEALVALTGVTKNVRFVGFVSEAEKTGWLRSANAFVMPGRGEGFGFVFLEALACGTPAVGSAVDGSREALMLGGLGILVDPSDQQSVISGIASALNTPRGVPTKLAYFSFEEFCNRVSRDLTALLGERYSDLRQKQ